MWVNYMKTILFDLDGTLTDSKEGILKSIQYALSCYGIEEDENNLGMFLGPPAHLAFQEFYGFSEEKSFEITNVFRKRYSEKGIYENHIYDGIKELLEKFYNDCIKLCVATSKPQIYTEKILESFEIRKYFDIVVGSDLEGKFCDKSDIIAKVIELSGEDKNDCVMVGDRKYDIIGAKENGIKSIAVLYGYGNREEFVLSGADFIAEKVENIYELAFF
ncbi:MAG: HAD hydrolase-like protein [Oscillospiraceae bacterium]|nr:HAD hydrolase-like protein [Oscillospiraceae bacterium]